MRVVWWSHDTRRATLKWRRSVCEYFALRPQAGRDLIFRRWRFSVTRSAPSATRGPWAYASCRLWFPVLIPQMSNTPVARGEGERDRVRERRGRPREGERRVSERVCRAQAPHARAPSSSPCASVPRCRTGSVPASRARREVVSAPRTCVPPSALHPLRHHFISNGVCSAAASHSHSLI